MSERDRPRPDNALGHIRIREYPEWTYAYPDARTVEIARLTAELKERDDLIATLTELIRCEFGLIVKTARTKPPEQTVTFIGKSGVRMSDGDWVTIGPNCLRCHHTLHEPLMCQILYGKQSQVNCPCCSGGER